MMTVLNAVIHVKPMQLVSWYENNYLAFGNFVWGKRFSAK